jgi:hypothetical protein
MPMGRGVAGNIRGVVGNIRGVVGNIRTKRH